MIEQAQARQYLALNVAAYRQARGWNKSQLAAKAGLYRADINRIEQAKHDSQMKTVIKIANALGTSIDTLLSAPENARSPL